MIAPRRYLTLLFLVLAGGLGLLAAFNLAVDPYASFRWSDIAGFNQAKSLKRDGGRVNKSVILANHRFDTLFFGTSQGEVGLNPDSAVLDGAGFNASLSNSNMVELSRTADYAARHQSPRLVVIALDFMAFSSSEVVAGDFLQSGFHGTSHASAYLRRLFSIDTVRDSIGVIKRSRRGEGQVFTKTGRVDPGMRPHHDYLADFDGVVRGLVAAEGAPKALPATLPQHSFATFAYQPERVERLRALAGRFAAKGTRVLLFVAPVHARYLDVIAEAGALPQYEQWKRDLAALAASAPCEIWDFSGFTTISTEPLPTTTAGTMRGYWDAGHFKAEIGDMVLARMLGREDRVGRLPADFGTILRPESVDGVLERFKRGRAAWQQDFPQESAAVKHLIQAMKESKP